MLMDLPNQAHTTTAYKVDDMPMQDHAIFKNSKDVTEHMT